MNSSLGFPCFEDHLPGLHQFILGLVDEYHSGRIHSWEDLEKRVQSQFTPQKMDEMETLVPGWRKMASYAKGITLTHVICVFLGLYMMPEFLRLNAKQQGLMKWIILLHDLEKEVEGKRDHAHAFRSAATAAKLLPMYGFATTTEYASQVDPWFRFTRAATLRLNDGLGNVQDNHKISEILSGIERMFGHNSPAALIIKTVLFHLSVNMKEWPPATPLSDDETQRCFDRDLLPLLRVMHLGDTDGWGLFSSTRERLRQDTNEAFDRLDQQTYR